MINRAFFVFLLLALPTTSWGAANCLHSHSWQCAGHHGSSSQGSQTGSGISTSGHSPDPGETNPHLGTASGGNQQPIVVEQPKPSKQKIPEPQKQVVLEPPKPTIVAPPKPTIVEPPKPTIVAPPKPTIVAPPQPTIVEPPLQTTVVEPPKPTIVAPPRPAIVEPPLQPVVVPVNHLPARESVSNTPMVIPSPQLSGTQGMQTSSEQFHVISSGERGVTGIPPVDSGSLLQTFFVEPGILNTRVEIYRSNDAKQSLYKDVIPMDKTGFHLTVFGTRPPDYAVPDP